jgi:hypothetical protein
MGVTVAKATFLVHPPTGAEICLMVDASAEYVGAEIFVLSGLASTGILFQEAGVGSDEVLDF